VFFKFALPNQPLNVPPAIDTTKWKKAILQLLQIEDLQRLQQALEFKETEVNIVSDGGVHDYNSNFGLVIAVKSRIVATNKGKIYSVEFHELSYRSELFGMLAAAVSLLYIIEKNKLQVASNKILHFYCDNKLVIKLVNA
jgi:hypothetical protein